MTVINNSSHGCTRLPLLMVITDVMYTMGATPLLVKVCIPELFYYLTVLIFSDSGCYGDYYGVVNLHQL